MIEADEKTPLGSATPGTTATPRRGDDGLLLAAEAEVRREPSPTDPASGTENLAVTVDGEQIPDVMSPETGPVGSRDIDAGPPQAVPHWTGWLLLALALFTLPWIAGLAVALPSKSEAAHYDVSWTGFDILLFVVLLRTGWSLLRHRAYVEVTAAMAGTLLVVDSWFDVMSAPTPSEFWTALGMAVLIQLPLAAFCLWIAGRVEFERRRRSDLMISIVRRLIVRNRSQARHLPKAH